MVFSLQAVPNRMKMFNKTSQHMSQTKWLTLLLTIFTSDNMYSALGSSCNTHTGPSGTIECIQIPRYKNEYQWATCLTDTYIKAKSSGKHFCEDRSATFCYYQCMIELYNANSGPVDKECCACQYGEEYTQSDLTLPSECYSPSGTNCGWYENCLEKKYQCRGTEDDYAMEFATKFCNLYIENFAKFSVEGQTWVDAVRKCLQVSLVPIIRPWYSKSCKEIKQIAFASHVPCYVLPNKQDPSISICNLELIDRLKVFWTIKSSLVMSVGSSLKAIVGIGMTMNECVIKPAIKKIKHFVLEMSIKIYNLLPFGRHRRSLSKSIDFLLLSNRIADDIAAKLHWSKKGVLWISTVDTNSNETLTNERLIYIHLADRKAYDMNSQNASSSDMKSIIQEFQSKVHNGDLNANLKDFSFEIISAKGCLDTHCNTTLFEVNATLNDNGK